MKPPDESPKPPETAEDDLLARVARELGVTREELRSAVQIGGPLPGDLKKPEGDPPSSS
jgi:hypothetical protein